MKNKWVCYLLLGSLLAPHLGVIAYAAAPQPTVDEAVYVNLDEYGVVDDMRIVKGTTLNGAQAISDYGNYAAVYNMTSHDAPALREDGVDFTLSDVDGQRFYYECIPNDPASLQMPWTFDVSYKLDGVPYAAKDLAGASGLVEISVRAMPNLAADEYYRNNMTLMVISGANMDETKSLEAPGAQIQSMGSYKFAVFMGLPGEENTYTFRIGSDHFESMGVYMLMAPATLSQLDTISDFRDVRDTLESAHDDVYAGLRDMLATMDSMQSGIQSMANGFADIDAMRQRLIASRGALDPDLDAVLDVLQTLAGDSDAILPEMEAALNNINDFHGNINGILTNLSDSRQDIARYYNLLIDVRDNLKQFESFLHDLDKETGENWLHTEELKSALKDLRTDSRSLQDELEDLRKELDGIGVITISMSSAMANVINTTQRQIDRLQSQISGLDPDDPLYNAVQSTLTQLEQQLVTLQQFAYTIQNVANVMDDMEKALEYVLMSTEALLHSIDTLCSAMELTITALEETDNALREYRGLGQQSAEHGQKAAQLATQTLSRLDDLLLQIQPLIDTLDQINVDANSLIPKIQTAGTTLTNTINAGNTLLLHTRDTLRSLRSQADIGTQQALNGLIDVLGRAAASGGTTNSLQTATDSIHDTISDEVDQLDSDSNILNMDNSLALHSVTSGKNPSPASVQFILRTSEISVDEMAEVQAEEAAAEDIGVWARIVNIFKKLITAIRSVFE